MITQPKARLGLWGEHLRHYPRKYTTMTTRTTRAHLDAKARTLNGMTKSPVESSRIVDGKRFSNIGHYHISGAYGGYCLHRMATEGGGVSDVFDCGHIPARQLAALMSAYTTGLYDATRGAA